MTETIKKTSKEYTIRFGERHQIVDFVKIVASYVLGGKDNIEVKPTIISETKELRIQIYCDPSDVGILLGKKEKEMYAFHKYCIQRIAQLNSRDVDIEKVELRVDDFNEKAKREKEIKDDSK